MSAQRYVGVDFSGGSKAGKTLWIAEGREERKGEELLITACDSAEKRWGVIERDDVLARLSDFISGLGDATVALDFPFGPPKGVFEGETWQERINVIVNDCSDVEDFVSRCRERFEGNVLRLTETERGGLCSYSPHIKYQTFHGISGVLAPLLDSNVRFEPMGYGDGCTTVLETYPAAVLSGIDGAERTGYKQKRYGAHETRRKNIESLDSTGVAFNGHNWLALCDDNALDSVVATYAAWQTADTGFDAIDHGYRQVEGYIYA